MRAPTASFTAAVLVAAAALALTAVGCGDSGEQGDTAKQPTQSSTSSTPAEPSPKPATTHNQQKGAEQAESTQASEARVEPRGPHAYQLQTLQRQFSKPKPTEAKGSAAAIEAGRQACRAKTPAEVKAQYLPESNLDADQEALVEELATYEEGAESDPSFSAGQIAATVYEMTLAEAEQSYGFQGCVYALVLELEGEIGGG